MDRSLMSGKTVIYVLLFFAFSFSISFADCYKSFTFDASKYTGDCTGFYSSASEYNDYREYYHCENKNCTSLPSFGLHSCKAYLSSSKESVTVVVPTVYGDVKFEISEGGWDDTVDSGSSISYGRILRDGNSFTYIFDDGGGVIPDCDMDLKVKVWWKENSIDEYNKELIVGREVLEKDSEHELEGGFDIKLVSVPNGCTVRTPSKTLFAPGLTLSFYTNQLNSPQNFTFKIECSEVVPCEDLDKGKNYTAAGSCEDDSGTHEDICIDDYTLKEYFCQYGSCAYETVDCREALGDSNAMCVNGRCTLCDYNLTLSPSSDSYQGTSHSWTVTATDSSSGPDCPSSITYNIAYSASTFCSSNTKPSVSSITIPKGGSKSFNVYVETTGDSCTLTVNANDPNGNTVATGKYTVYQTTAECSVFFSSISCPSYVEVNNPFKISYTYYHGEYCNKACIALEKPSGTSWSTNSFTKAGFDTEDESLTAPSTPGSYKYTVKIKGNVNCYDWDGSGPDDSKSCTIQVVKDTTPPEYSISWEDLECGAG